MVAEPTDELKVGDTVSEKCDAVVLSDKVAMIGHENGWCKTVKIDKRKVDSYVRMRLAEFGCAKADDDGWSAGLPSIGRQEEQGGGRRLAHSPGRLRQSR